MVPLRPVPLPASPRFSPLPLAPLGASSPSLAPERGTWPRHPRPLACWGTCYAHTAVTTKMSSWIPQAPALNASASVCARATGARGTAAAAAPLSAPETEAGAGPSAAAAAAAAAPSGAASLVGGRRTGGSLGFQGATEPLGGPPGAPGVPLQDKHVVLVRHGLSSWNEEGRVQGSSDQSLLSEQGALQALRCREALRFMDFDCCYASPISRARTSAELLWEGRQGPLVFLDSLREANLLFLEGMLNSDAKSQHPEEFRAWREDPANFHVGGVYPVRRLWGQAREAWGTILGAKESTILVVTHKSILRALVCTALGMGPERFRALDVNNGGICVMKISTKGEPMLESMNLTAHLQCSVHYNL